MCGNHAKSDGIADFECADGGPDIESVSIAIVAGTNDGTDDCTDVRPYVQVAIRITQYDPDCVARNRCSDCVTDCESNSDTDRKPDRSSVIDDADNVADGGTDKACLCGW